MLKSTHTHTSKQTHEKKRRKEKRDWENDKGSESPFVMTHGRDMKSRRGRD